MRCATVRGLRLLSSAAVTAASLLSAAAVAQPERVQSSRSDPGSAATPTAVAPVQDQHSRRRVVVLIRDLQGKQLGSGVLVSNASSGDWVLTNRHVVQNAAQVCVSTAEGRMHLGSVELQPARWQGLDLALVWLPRAQTDPPRPVAEIVDPALALGEMAVVVAAGHPADAANDAGSSHYREERGLLLPLLQGPLKEGFDLTYTAAVQKGMSGGGLFVGDRLIGINGAHAHPLWPGSWQRPDGTAVGEPLNSQLELVALGLSSRHLQNLRLQERQLSRPAATADAFSSCVGPAADNPPTF